MLKKAKYHITRGAFAVFINKSQFEPGPDSDLELPEATGAKRFMQIIQEEFLNLIKLNLLLLASCLPVITIPPALFAAHQVVRKMVRDEAVSCWRDYKTALKTGWKRAYGAFFLIAFPVSIGGYGAIFYLSHVEQSPLLILPFAFCIFIAVVAMLSSTYFYGLLCTGTSLKEAVKPALLLGVARPLRAILAVLCWYGLPLLAILFFPLSGAYLALIGFTFPFLLGSFYTRTVLKRFCEGQGKNTEK